MQTSSQPKLLPVPFANAGSKQDVPNDSQIGITAGRASYTDGFPPLTRTPLAAGGVPPFGTDFNGVLNDITAAVRWNQSGAGYPFDSSFNAAISGYPKGAKIPSSTLDGFWLNTVDGNATNPENTTSATTGWVPSGFYGFTSISGLSGSSVTLTTLQAGRDRIVLTGTLTANINLILPAWIKSWDVINSCTGQFIVNVKTPLGSGVPVPSNTNAKVFCDGVNITSFYQQGALIARVLFTSSGVYTPSAGAKKIVIEAVGGGGGGGGAPATTSTQSSCGSGGGCGDYVKTPPLNAQSLSITIGSGGAGSNGLTSPSVGGDTAVGNIILLRGGSAGYTGTASTSSVVLGLYSSGSSSNALYPASSVYLSGGQATRGMVIAASSLTGALGGSGGGSPLGGGGVGQNTAAAANSATEFGGGGAGAANFGASGSKAGGSGFSGVVIIWEYA